MRRIVKLPEFHFRKLVVSRHRTADRGFSDRASSAPHLLPTLALARAQTRSHRDGACRFESQPGSRAPLRISPANGTRSALTREPLLVNPQLRVCSRFIRPRVRLDAGGCRPPAHRLESQSRVRSCLASAPQPEAHRPSHTLTIPHEIVKAEARHPVSLARLVLACLREHQSAVRRRDRLRQPRVRHVSRVQPHGRRRLLPRDAHRRIALNRNDVSAAAATQLRPLERIEPEPPARRPQARAYPQRPRRFPHGLVDPQLEIRLKEPWPVDPQPSVRPHRPQPKVRAVQQHTTRTQLARGSFDILDRKPHPKARELIASGTNHVGRRRLARRIRRRVDLARRRRHRHDRLDRPHLPRHLLSHRRIHDLEGPLPEALLEPGLVNLVAPVGHPSRASDALGIPALTTEGMVGAWGFAAQPSHDVHILLVEVEHLLGESPLLRPRLDRRQAAPALASEAGHRPPWHHHARQAAPLAPRPGSETLVRTKQVLEEPSVSRLVARRLAPPPRPPRALDEPFSSRRSRRLRRRCRLRGAVPHRTRMLPACATSDRESP